MASAMASTLVAMAGEQRKGRASWRAANGCAIYKLKSNTTMKASSAKHSLRKPLVFLYVCKAKVVADDVLSG